MAFEGPEQCATLDVPEPDREVTAAGYGTTTVGRKREARHPRGVPMEASDFIAGVRLPEPHTATVASRQDVSPIGGECQTLDFSRPGHAVVYLFCTRDIP